MAIRNSRRVLATVGAVGVIGALGAAGTYSLFTGSYSVDQSITSGTMTLTPGAGSNLSVSATDIAPSDKIQRVLDLIPGGTVDAVGFKLTTTDATVPAVPGNPLLLATYGLQMKIDQCDVAWTYDVPTNSYSCSGVTTSALASGDALRGNASLSGLNVAAGSHNYLMIELELPSAADNTFQNQSATINYAFSSTQRAGVYK